MLQCKSDDNDGHGRFSCRYLPYIHTYIKHTFLYTCYIRRRRQQNISRTSQRQKVPLREVKQCAQIVVGGKRGRSYGVRKCFGSARIKKRTSDCPTIATCTSHCCLRCYEYVDEDETREKYGNLVRFLLSQFFPSFFCCCCC